MREEAGTIVANEPDVDDVDDRPVIHVEFYGLARERAGRASADIRGQTLREVALAIERIFPRLKGLWDQFRTCTSPFRISLNGERFVIGDVDLPANIRVILLSADAGG